MHARDLRFSRTEVLHLAMAVTFLTVAFTFVLSREDSLSPEAALRRLQAPWQLYLASFFAVSTGFVLHELGHKALAQRFGHWAEFRGEFKGLLVSLAIALGLGFLFAAPGAVMINGRVTPRENGLISLMGPGVNFVIALLAVPFTFATDPDAFLPFTMEVMAFVNSILAVFNLIPVGNLDGRKIWHWNKAVYIAAMAIALGFTFYLWVFVGIRI